MVCRDFILPEPASYVFFYALFNLRNLLYITLADAPAAFDEVEADPNMEKLWQAYQKKFSYAADLSWHTVMESIRSLYELARE